MDPRLDPWLDPWPDFPPCTCNVEDAAADCRLQTADCRSPERLEASAYLHAIIVSRLDISSLQCSFMPLMIDVGDVGVDGRERCSRSEGGSCKY